LARTAHPPRSLGGRVVLDHDISFELQYNITKKYKLILAHREATRQLRVCLFYPVVELFFCFSLLPPHRMIL
jgi:hypothetical protein